MPMVDLHAHLLPGVDDGPASTAEAVGMARLAVADGTETIVCTPHVSDHYRTSADQMQRGLAALRDAIAQEEVPLEVLPGAEIALSQLPRLVDDDLAALSLGGSGRWLLLELPFVGWPLELPAVLHDLEVRGFGAVLAHPERAQSLQTAPDRLRDAVGRGALVQITAGSLLGDHGHRARRTSEELLRAGLVHLIASDAHSPGWRPPGLRDAVAAVARLGLDPVALEWMVGEGPRRIADGKDVRPPRLAPARRPGKTRRNG